MTAVLHAITLAWMLAAPGLAGSLAAPDPAALAPGQYFWRPEIAPQGPLVVIISLDEQRAYVYRNGIAIGLSTISSGRKAGGPPQLPARTIIHRRGQRERPRGQAHATGPRFV